MNKLPAQGQIDQIRKEIFEARQMTMAQAIVDAAKLYPGSARVLSNLETVLGNIENQLVEIPQVDIALVGRSRHGKSTLINSIAGAEILRTSAIRPCSATIVKLVHDSEWSIEIQFVTKSDLKSDWKNAVADARDFLAGNKEQPDNPRYLQETLERFIELFKIDKHLSPNELVEQVATFKIDKETAKLFGKSANQTTANIEKLKETVAKFLSTDGHLWTIVDRCTIKGPFKNWHSQLGVIDLPGTNDLNAHRAQITNSVRNRASAVALVTSESNLGVDIESWLRDSQVLSNFLEARESRRQHLFIIRTQLDGHVPKIDLQFDELSAVSKEDQEERLYQDAIEKYKQEQTEAYHDMLQDIVSPMLQASGGSDEYREKRRELIQRISKVPVHFVSALAYEVFQGRHEMSTRQRNNLLANFNDDENLTGIPGLLDYVNQIAAEYLESNFFEDKKREIASEVAQLGQFFRTQQAALEIAKNGAGAELTTITSTIRQDVLPWINNQISTTVSDFHGSGEAAAEALQHRLDQSWLLSDRRLKDKVDKWNLYAWNSLRAMGRKGGVHLTSNGTYIDISQDICSVLVDDLLLVWTSYRDHIIEKQVNRVTQEFSSQLIGKLNEARTVIDDPEARSAINDMIRQLSNIAHLNREKLIRSVDQKIKELESIRQPAYSRIRESFRPVFDQIAEERGAGCQQRMRQMLEHAFKSKLGGIRSEINSLVLNSASGLLEHCSEAMTNFGRIASDDISNTLNEVRVASVERDLVAIEQDALVLDGAVKFLPAPA